MEILNSIFQDIEMPMMFPTRNLDQPSLLEEDDDNAWQDVVDDSELDTFNQLSQNQTMDTASSATLCSGNRNLVYLLQDQIDMSGVQHLLEESNNTDIEMA